VSRSEQVRQPVLQIVADLYNCGLQPQHASSSLTTSLLVYILLSVSNKASRIVQLDRLLYVYMRFKPFNKAGITKEQLFKTKLLRPQFIMLFAHPTH